MAFPVKHQMFPPGGSNTSVPRALIRFLSFLGENGAPLGLLLEQVEASEEKLLKALDSKYFERLETGWWRLRDEFNCRKCENIGIVSIHPKTGETECGHRFGPYWDVRACEECASDDVYLASMAENINRKNEIWRDAVENPDEGGK